MATKKKKITNPVVLRLAEFFQRNGYVRRQSADRLKAEGTSSYKKGEEVRLVAATKTELAEMRRLLRDQGFKLGKPFTTAGTHRQPIYGKEQVRRFLELVGEPIPE